MPHTGTSRFDSVHATRVPGIGLHAERCISVLGLPEDSNTTRCGIAPFFSKSGRVKLDMVRHLLARALSGWCFYCMR